MISAADLFVFSTSMLLVGQPKGHTSQTVSNTV